MLRETSRVLLEAGGEVQGLSIPLGQWHTVNVLEPTVILECKDGKYEPLSPEDVVEVLTDSADPTDYLKKMRKRDPELVIYIGTNCPQVQMTTHTGKKRNTLAADAEQLFRIIQSIPSPKAEPFKQWLARVGYERLDEIADPEKAILRGADYYRAKGYPEAWINQRLQTIEMRKELTDEWKARGITKEKEYAILTNNMTRAWSGMSVQEYKQMKGLLGR